MKFFFRHFHLQYTAFLLLLCPSVIPLEDFLGASAKLRKATISFITLCPSVRMEKLGSDLTDYDKILYLRVFRKSVEQTQVLLKSDKNRKYFT
jgi:hypothetical protein